MSPVSTRFSYKDRKSNKIQRLRILFWLFLVLLLYLVISEVFISSYTLQNSSMSPSIEKGHALLANPLKKADKLQRGDIVVLAPSYYSKDTLLVRMTNLFLRILTFQRLEIKSLEQKEWEKSITIKRVIALPGDTVYLDHYIAYIKTVDNEFFLSEFETALGDYNIHTPEDNNPDFSRVIGNTDEIVLNPGEYFVLGDNRGFSSDSSYWGILPANKIKGKIWFRFWPLKHAGKK